MKTIKRSLILILTIAGLFLSGAEVFPQQTAGQLYEKALYLEEAKGELKGAIDIYNQIVENKNANQSFQAKALLHIGMCYEKLGMKEAIKAYQHLVNNFPAQKNEVALARERLNKLGQMLTAEQGVPLIPKFTKIQIPNKLMFWSVELSPDGKNLAFVSEEKLWVMPISGNISPEFSGNPIELNTDGIKVEWSGLSWSADGKWLAFNEIPLKDKPENEKWNQSIFIVPSNGGKPKKIIENYRDFTNWNYRISLSPDGKNLAYSSVEKNEQHIYTKQIDGSSPKQLVDIQAREPVFSPDGKLIAYVEDKNLGKAGSNLWIVPSNGGVSKLIARAGNASSPIWSPDGSMIAFLDLDKDKQINIVQLSEKEDIPGKVTSINAPEGIEKVNHLAGWAPNNKISAVLVTEQEFALYTLPRKGGQAAIVLHQDGVAVHPRWSPDGYQILYVTPETNDSGWAFKLTLASVSANGGTGELLTKHQDGKFVHPLPPQAGNRFSPDGKSIVTAGWIPGDTVFGNSLPATRIWKLSSDGLKSEKITDEKGPFADLSPSWSPDGEKIAFVRYKIKGVVGTNIKFEEYCIYIINSSGEEPEILFSDKDHSILLPVWSPDGKMIAFISRNDDAKFRFNLINVKTGEVRVVYEIPQYYSPLDPCWSPDSRRIAFNDGKAIKAIDIYDGSIEDIKTNLTDDVKILYLDWSHDDEKFVFGGWKQGIDEFWLLEDFLPLVNK